MRFERYPDVYFGFDLAAQRAALLGCLADIAAGQTPETGSARWVFARVKEDR